MLVGNELTRTANLDFDRITDLLAIPSWNLTITDMMAIARSVLGDRFGPSISGRDPRYRHHGGNRVAHGSPTGTRTKII
jgi:hypothetical protein